jgi:4-amino-4-deoxy-L-arabinose transferase-like glycosyltransferase
MRRITNIVAKNWILILIILIGVFLRFYRLGDFAMFLSDQGRDAIIIKRILTGEHFPAIGAPTSVGQVYLGPFYYYFIAPWLLLFNFAPVGLAFGVAFFSSLFLLCNFLIIKKLVNIKTAYISTIFLSLSSTMVDFSRFSWNPNLLPFFSFLTAYFAIESVKTKRWYFFALTGAFLSFSVQLHYLALFLGLPVAFVYLFDLFKKKNHFISKIMNIVISVFFFALFTLPLIIFDLRHDFLNSKNFLLLFKSTQSFTTSKLENLINTFIALNKYSLNITLNTWQAVVLLVFILVSSLIILYRSKNFIKTFIMFFLICFLGLSLYSGPKFPHYLGMAYPFYFLVISYFLGEISGDLFGKIIVSIFIVMYILLSLPKFNFITMPAANQIGHTRKVADFLADKINHKPFNIATWPVEFTEDNYLYFLELQGLRPADRRKVEITNQMFVLCNKEPCQVINSPSWNISMFGKAKIAAEWKVEDVKIYKLVR